MTEQPESPIRASTDIEIRVRHGTHPLVEVTGELDVYTTPWLLSAVRELHLGGRPLEMDLRGVELVDSAGLAALIAVAREMAPAPLTVRPRPTLARLLAITGLDRSLRVILPDGGALAGER